MKWTTLPSAWLALAFGVLASGCGRPHAPATPATGPAVEVEIRAVALEAVPRRIEAMGTVEPLARIAPGTKILGRVEHVGVREGDRVTRGQLLARIESRDLQAAVEQARAAVAMAEAQLDNARAQHRRIEQLNARGSATEKMLEDTLAAFRIATAALDQARANLAAAEVTLDYAEVRSPIDGWVTARQVEAGDMAAPGAPLFRIEDLSRVKIRVQVPESAIVALAPGSPARVVVDVVGPERDAEVSRVIPAGDARSRTFEVELVLDNPDGRLKSGMFARAVFEQGVREGLFVPLTAVVERGQLRGVYVVGTDGHARLRWVRLGPTQGERVEVLSGLVEGDRYVAAPTPELVDDALVAQG